MTTLNDRIKALESKYCNEYDPKALKDAVYSLSDEEMDYLEMAKTLSDSGVSNSELRKRYPVLADKLVQEYNKSLEMHN